MMTLPKNPLEQRKAAARDLVAARGGVLEPADLQVLADGGIMEPGALYLPAGTVGLDEVRRRERVTIGGAE